MTHTPMGRYGEANELVGAVVYLASEKASSFVTGSILRVDGGFPGDDYLRRGDTAMRRHGDAATRRLGDAGTRRHGDTATRDTATR